MKNKQNAKNKCVQIALAALLFSIPALFGCGVAARDATENNPANLNTIIITEADKTAAVEIPSAQNHERGNASGPSIPSGAHSEAFPGIVFVWDSKATNNGYLIVTSEVFDKYESFTLTTKEGSSYWDFVIKPETGQQKNKDGNYIFYILRASGSNKINKVFVSEWIEKEGSSQTDEAKIAVAKSELAIPVETDCDIDLPAVLNGVAISWASSDEAVISSAGHVTMGLYEAVVTLTATLALGGASDTKEFDVTVPAVVEEKAKLIEATGRRMSSATFVTMTMEYLNENVVFIFSIDKGVLDKVKIGEMSDSYFPVKNLNVRSGESVLWIGREDLDDGSLVNEEFVEIILKLEQNIVGYAVVWCIGNSGFVLKSVLFPQIDGKYQNVSEEYVKTAFEEVRANYWDYFEEMMWGTR